MLLLIHFIHLVKSKLYIAIQIMVYFFLLFNFVEQICPSAVKAKARAFSGERSELQWKLSGIGTTKVKKTILRITTTTTDRRTKNDTILRFDFPKFSIFWFFGRKNFFFRNLFSKYFTITVCDNKQLHLLQFCTPPPPPYTPLIFWVFELWKWPGYQNCSKMFKLFEFFCFE